MGVEVVYFFFSFSLQVFLVKKKNDLIEMLKKSQGKNGKQKLEKCSLLCLFIPVFFFLLSIFVLQACLKQSKVGWLYLLSLLTLQVKGFFSKPVMYSVSKV